jgi:MFS family permease
VRERYPRLFDALVWPAVIVGDAALLLNLVAVSFMAVQRLGADHSRLAWLGVTSGTTYALTCPLLARVGARLGLKRSAVAGAALYVLWSLLLTQAQSIGQLAACYAVAGLGGALLWPNLEALLAQGWQGPLLRKRLSIFNTMWCAGTVLGPLFCLWFYPKEPAALGEGGRAAINTLFYISAALAGAMALFLIPWRSRAPQPAEAAAHEGDDGPCDPVRLRTFRLMSYMANFMCYVVLAVLRQLFEALANEQWAGQDPVARHCWLLVLLAAPSTAAFVVMYYAHRWSYRLKRHLAAQGLLAAAMVLVALSGNVYWLAVSFVVIGVTTSLIYSGSLFYSVEGQSASSHMAGWHEAVLGAGGACGLLLSGQIPWLLARLGVESQYWLMRSPYLLAAGVFVLGILLQLAVYARFASGFRAATTETERAA